MPEHDGSRGARNLWERSPTATPSTARFVRMQAMPGAIGIHVGLGIVCASAIYTGWQRSIVTYPQWAAMLLVAGALLFGAFSGGAGGVRRTWVRLTLALAGLLAFKLCYDPQLEMIPRLSEELPEAFLSTYPGIALIGIIIAVVAWTAYLGAGGERKLGEIPMRRSALLAAAFVGMLALIVYMILHRTHDLPLSESLRALLMVAQAGGLVVVLLGIGGGPGIGRAPHICLALTLALAFARNMAFPME